jgi:hypothetical protein
VADEIAQQAPQTRIQRVHESGSQPHRAAPPHRPQVPHPRRAGAPSRREHVPGGPSGRRLCRPRMAAVRTRAGDGTAGGLCCECGAARWCGIQDVADVADVNHGPVGWGSASLGDVMLVRVGPVRVCAGGRQAATDGAPAGCGQVQPSRMRSARAPRRGNASHPETRCSSAISRSRRAQSSGDCSRAAAT